MNDLRERLDLFNFLSRKRLTDCCRNKSLIAQNSILHDQLEAVTSQAARIRELNSSSEAAGGEFVGTDAQADELRTLIGYLRKDKDILEMQLDLQKQENSRMKTEFERITATLDDTRVRLAEVSL